MQAIGASERMFDLLDRVPAIPLHREGGREGRREGGAQAKAESAVEGGGYGGKGEKEDKKQVVEEEQMEGKVGLVCVCDGVCR